MNKLTKCPLLTLGFGYWPAIVSANTPNTDAANRLSVKQSLAQRVNQIHCVVLQDHQHVFALLQHTIVVQTGWLNLILLAIKS